MRSVLAGAGVALAMIGAAGATRPLAGTTWRSDACDLTIALQADGNADFISSMGRHAAAWRMDGDELIVEVPVEASADLREFRGSVAADRIEGVHSWTDVAGMTGERSCTLVPKV